MSQLYRIGFACVISALLVFTAGCPTLPSLVRGTGTGNEGEENPGALIEWPGSQVDPTGEDTAGFNQVTSADMNGDGLMDLISTAYESQPVQIHLQQRGPDGTIGFRSFSIAGSMPIVHVTALSIADMDLDGNLDIVLAIQDNGLGTALECASKQGTIIILFAPPDPADQLNWDEYNLSFNYRCVLDDDGDPITFSTLGFDGNDFTYTSLDVGDVNQDGFPDIVAAFNGCNDDRVPFKQVELWINPADNLIRTNEELTGTRLLDTDFDGEPDGCEPIVINPWHRVILQLGIRDRIAVRLADVDLDTDLDVIAVRPDSKSLDITWQANPLLPEGGVTVDFWGGADFNGLLAHPIGESDTGFDLIEIGDLDGDGLEDVLAMTKGDRLLKWFRHPKNAGKQTFPWEVYNLVQYTELTPTAMEIADVDQNGQMDVVVAADGRIRWFTPLRESPYEPWSEQFVTDDRMIPDGGGGEGDESVFAPINSVHAVDIDEDGRLDIAATLDRAGVNDDMIVWLRNQSRDE